MDLIDLVDLALEDDQLREPSRGYLGMSSVGHDCTRKLWYDFRFVSMPFFSAKTLQCFEDGHRSEAIMIDRILNAVPQAEFLTHKEDGNQIGFIDIDGHFRGHCDGAISGIEETGNGWAIWEHKCSDRVKVNKLIRLKESDENSALAAWNWMYYVQALLYMHYSELDMHLTTVVSSGSRKPQVQVITKADPHQAQIWIDHATYVIKAGSPPDRFRVDPEYYQCKWCDHAPVCHHEAVAYPTCRTCIHARPVKSGEWSCSKFDFNPDTKAQVAGCKDHRYIPEVLDNFADFIRVDGEDTLVYKHKKTNNEFSNGFYSSKEIHSIASTDLLGAKAIDDIKEVFDATIEGE